MRTLDVALTDPALSANDFRVLAFCYTVLFTDRARMLSFSDIASKVHIKRQTVSGCIDRLAARGYLLHSPKYRQDYCYQLPPRHAFQQA